MSSVVSAEKTSFVLQRDIETLVGQLAGHAILKGAAIRLIRPRVRKYGGVLYKLGSFLTASKSVKEKNLKRTILFVLCSPFECEQSIHFLSRYFNNLNEQECYQEKSSVVIGYAPKNNKVLCTFSLLWLVQKHCFAFVTRQISAKLRGGVAGYSGYF